MATGSIASTSCSAAYPFRLDLDGSTDSVAKYLPTEETLKIGTVIAALAACATLPALLRKLPHNAKTTEKDKHANNKRKILPAIISAKFFALGLMISGMARSSKIMGFLDMNGIKNGTWDPTLAFVMGGGLAVSFLSYQFVKGFNYFSVSTATRFCTVYLLIELSFMIVFFLL